MARDVGNDADPDPTWEEAVAEFEAGEPVELVRSPRKLMIEYKYADGYWRATIPGLTGFTVTAASLPQAKARVGADLATYLDSAVELDERVVEPPINRGAEQTLEIHRGADIIVTQHTRSRSRAFISSRSLKVSA